MQPSLPINPERLRPKQLGQLTSCNPAQQIHLKEAILRMQIAGGIGNIEPALTAHGGNSQRIPLDGNLGRESVCHHTPIELGQTPPQQQPASEGGRYRQEEQAEQSSPKPLPKPMLLCTHDVPRAGQLELRPHPAILSQSPKDWRIIRVMRQIWITKAGSPEVLQVKEAPDPVAEDGQVRIRVRAAGINFADLMARTGMYQDAPPIPCVVGYEVSGVVDQVGAKVSDFSVGDRVLAMPKFGGYTDTLVISAQQAFRMPDKMTFEEGAALPVVYLTAHHMMLYVGTLPRGSRVLIHSAAGGVGLAAIDLAKAHGCEIFGSASAGKHSFLRERGCQHPIDSSQDVTAQVRAIVGKDSGVDLVLDAVGGKSFTDSYNLLRETGRLVCFGVSSMSPGKSRSIPSALAMLLRTKRYSPLSLMMDNKTVQGVNMGHLFSRLDIVKPQFVALLAMYERGEIRPYVDRTFPFAEAAAAHHFLHDRKAKGKVVLTP